MKYAIVGAGAIGGYLGAKLALAGEEVVIAKAVVRVELAGFFGALGRPPNRPLRAGLSARGSAVGPPALLVGQEGAPELRLPPVATRAR